MTNTNEGAGQRDRSPAFPVLSLEAALGKLAEFEAHFKRSSARPEKVGEAWGIKTKGYVDRIAAALRYFGLLEYQGSGKDRNVIVSEEGRKYLRAHQEETKQEVIKSAALRPKQIAKFWNDWGADRPADPACLDALIQKHGFSDAGARDFLKVYDATIAYAKLSGSDKLPPEGQKNENEPENPPMTPRTQDILDRPSSLIKPPEAHGPMLQEVFNLDEGPVTLTVPSSLSEESYEELKAQLELFLRRQQRRARQRLGAETIRRMMGAKDDEAAN